MNIIKLLFAASKGIITGVGLGFTTVLFIVSLALKQEIGITPKIDLVSLTSGGFDTVESGKLGDDIRR